MLKIPPNAVFDCLMVRMQDLQSALLHQCGHKAACVFFTHILREYEIGQGLVQFSLPELHFVSQGLQLLHAVDHDHDKGACILRSCHIFNTKLFGSDQSQWPFKAHEAGCWIAFFFFCLKQK